MSCGCNSPSKTKYCPVNIVLENVDTNDPLITGYPTNTLAFIDFARDTDDEVISYNNEYAGNIYKFNGASWDLAFQPTQRIDLDTDFMAMQGNFTLGGGGAVERTLHSFKVLAYIEYDGTQLGDDTVAIVTSAYVPESITWFTAWCYDSSGANGVQVPGYIDDSGNIILKGATIAAPPSPYLIIIDFEYSATR